MGVLFTREYSDIIDEFSEGITLIDRFYEFLEMELNDWNDIPEDEKQACIKTMSDDMFYALGNEGVIEIGGGTIKHDKFNSHIQIFNGDMLVRTISLA